MLFQFIDLVLRMSEYRYIQLYFSNSRKVRSRLLWKSNSFRRFSSIIFLCYYYFFNLWIAICRCAINCSMSQFSQIGKSEQFCLRNKPWILGFIVKSWSAKFGTVWTLHKELCEWSTICHKSRLRPEFMDIAFMSILLALN